MKHLEDEQIRQLAESILMQKAFSSSQQRDMLHIANCEECYRLLLCTMAVIDTTEHMEYALAPKQPEAKSSAVIQLVVFDMSALLEQRNAQTADWIFDAPLAAGTRSADGEENAVKMLEDIDNAGAFVAYDPVRRTLEIQLRREQFDAVPKVWLKDAEGVQKEVPLQKDDIFYWAEVRDLNPGTYEITLEK